MAQSRTNTLMEEDLNDQNIGTRPGSWQAEPMSTSCDTENILGVENNSKDWFCVRYVLAFMGFLGFANVYAMRVNLSVAIVAMVNSSAFSQNLSMDETCSGFSNETKSSKDGEFLWNEATQGIILGSFFWGYIITNPIGGHLGDRIGGKRVFCFGIFVTSLFTLFTPLASQISPYLLTALRTCIGLGEGVTFPSMNSMLSRWIPPPERSRIVSLVFSGSQAGIVISYPLSGLMCNLTFLDGWPLAFYVFGSLGLIWCIIWMLIIHDSPSSHPRISPEEKLYILSSCNANRRNQKPTSIPFRAIATSLPFWAILVAHVCQNWGFYLLLTELPTYMKNILHFDIKENSVFSALPYLLMAFFGFFMGWVSDFTRKMGIVSTTWARKICNSIGMYVPMVCLILAGYSGCNTKITLALLTLGVGVNGAVFSGYMNSHLDIANNFAGTLMGFTNCAATIPGFLAPIVVGAIISGQETLSSWRLVFWIAGIVYFIGSTFFLLFATGEQQPWNTLCSPVEGNKVRESDEDECLLQDDNQGTDANEPLVVPS